MSGKDLALKLLQDDERPPPCSDCNHFDFCKHEKLACEQFLQYCGMKKGNKGKPYQKIPHRDFYFKVFPRDPQNPNKDEPEED
jgi:hypothetical protein